MPRPRKPKAIDLDKLSPSMNRLRHAILMAYCRHPDARAVIMTLDPNKPVRITWPRFTDERDPEYAAEVAHYHQRVLATRVRTDPVSGCIICDRSLDHSGYPAVWMYGQKYANASRLVCSAIYGPMPAEVRVRHDRSPDGRRCSSRACINGDHLEPGSAADDAADGRLSSRSYTNPNGRHRADEMRVNRWTKRARSRGVTDVRLLKRAAALPQWMVEKINGRLVLVPA